MISPISGSSPIYNSNPVYNLNQYPLRPTGRSTVALGQTRGAMPEMPVTPVKPAPVVSIDTARRTDLSAPMWVDSYPREQANRARVTYAMPQPGEAAAPAPAQTGSPTQALTGFPWSPLPGAGPAELAARLRVQYPGQEQPSAEALKLPGADRLPGAEKDDEAAALGAEGAQQAAEEGRCQTCEERKYQDGSDDSSVSFQTPTHIDPDAAQAAVRGHELEHVSHEQAKAKREGRKVVSQTVTMHTDICPECGRVYVSGGTTRTVTKADNAPPAQEAAEGEE